MKKLSNEQKMKGYILRTKVTGITFVMCAVGFYIARFLPDKGWHGQWIQAAATEAFPLIFLGGALLGFGLIGITRFLLTEVSECRARIQLLEDHAPALEGQGGKSS